MNNEYLEKAKQAVPSNKELIVLASKRAAELASGKCRPTIKVDNELEGNYLDIALLEIAQGNIKAEFREQGGNDILQELAAMRDANLAKETPVSARIDEDKELGL